MDDVTDSDLAELRKYLADDAPHTGLPPYPASTDLGLQLVSDAAAAPSQSFYAESCGVSQPHAAAFASRYDRKVGPPPPPPPPLRLSVPHSSGRSRTETDALKRMETAILQFWLHVEVVDWYTGGSGGHEPAVRQLSWFGDFTSITQMARIDFYRGRQQDDRSNPQWAHWFGQMPRLSTEKTGQPDSVKQTANWMESTVGVAYAVATDQCFLGAGHRLTFSPTKEQNTGAQLCVVIWECCEDLGLGPPLGVQPPALARPKGRTFAAPSGVPQPAAIGPPPPPLRLPPHPTPVAIAWNDTHFVTDVLPASAASQWVSWSDTPFVTEVLPAQAILLAAAVPNLSLCRSKRDAINEANGRLYSHLPLLTSVFTAFNLAQALGETDAVVVAERVPRVPDINRGGADRVDFFVYRANGEVVRYHPGTSSKQDMQPHVMTNASVCFSRALAANDGVGQALHRQPPGLLQGSVLALTSHAPGATQPGVPLATRADLDQLCTYDVLSLSWRVVRTQLDRLPPHDDCVDWSDGSTFPWWLWLANTGKVRDIVDKGVTSVEVHIRTGSKSILVHTRAGSKYTFSENGKMTVKH